MRAWCAPLAVRAAGAGAGWPAGYRKTRQREAVVTALRTADGGIDVPEPHRLARRQEARLSLSTVYRTLHLLARHALVDALHLAEEHHHYEPRTGRPAHYHLMCVACGDAQEVAGLAVNTGYSGHGIMGGPGVARLTVGALLGRLPAPENPFRPDRPTLPRELDVLYPRCPSCAPAGRRALAGRPSGGHVGDSYPRLKGA